MKLPYLEERKGAGRGWETAEKRKKDVKNKSTEKDTLVFQNDRREERDKQQEQAAEEKEEERKARCGRTGAETKARRDRQRQVEKICET